jgi:hypothetical protein
VLLLRSHRASSLQKAISKIVRVRDTTLHANYEQAAHQAGCDVKTYFLTQYTPEIDRMGRLFLALLSAVDQRTGIVHSPPTIEVPIP